MHDQRNRRVYITRSSVDHSTRGQRVYVTGPHFGQGRGSFHDGAVFSSTPNREEASTFPCWVAEGMIERKSWQVAETEPADA